MSASTTGDALVNFAVNFVATLLGVFVAFILSLEYDKRRKRSQEKETQIRAIRAIKSELEANLEELGEEVGVGPEHFRVSAYQSTVSSGSFSHLRPELQGAITDAYRQFDRVNALSDNFSMPTLKGLAGSDSFGKAWNLVINVSKIESKHLRESLSDAIKLLENELRLLEATR